MDKLSSILKSSKGESVILLVDTDKQVWEIVKRTDLELNNINKEKIEDIESLATSPWKLNKDEELDIDLVLKIQNDSFGSSEIDISKVSELNISNLMKDTNHDISGVY